MAERHFVSVPGEERLGPGDAQVVGEGLPAYLCGLGTESLQWQKQVWLSGEGSPFL